MSFLFVFDNIACRNRSFEKANMWRGEMAPSVGKAIRSNGGSFDLNTNRTHIPSVDTDNVKTVYLSPQM